MIKMSSVHSFAHVKSGHHKCLEGHRKEVATVQQQIDIVMLPFAIEGSFKVLIQPSGLGPSVAVHIVDNKECCLQGPRVKKSTPSETVSIHPKSLERGKQLLCILPINHLCIVMVQ